MLNYGRTVYTESFKIGFMVSDQNVHVEALRKLASFAEDFFNANSTTVKLDVVFKTYDAYSLYGLVDTTCWMADQSVVTVVSPDGSNQIATMADILSPINVPLISVRGTDPNLRSGLRNNIIQLSPDDSFQAAAIIDLLKYYHWMDLSIVSSDTLYGVNGASTLQKLLASQSTNFNLKLADGFKASRTPELVNTLIRVKESLTRVIVLICEGRYGAKVFREAERIGLMGAGYVWIVTDGITSNSAALGSSVGNYPSYLTGLIGIYPAIQSETDLFREFQDTYLKYADLPNTALSPAVLGSFDAIQMAGSALVNFTRSTNVAEPQINCSDQGKWSRGDEFFEVLRNVQLKGVASDIALNPDGTPQKVTFQIVNFIEPGYFSPIGVWRGPQKLGMFYDREGNAVRFLGNLRHHPFGIANTLGGRHLRLGVTHNPPFAIKKECETGICWDGICPDAVRELASILNFSFDFVEPDDGLFGTYDDRKEVWSGLIGLLLRGEIDMITMDVSVSFERENFIDFSVSFMDSGISLAVKGESGKKNLFFFLSPFTSEVWLLIALSIVIMALIQRFFCRLSPYGSHGRKEFAKRRCECRSCRKTRISNTSQADSEPPVKCLLDDIEDSKEMLSMHNAFWLIGAGSVSQGTEVMPRSMSGRFILFTWWFFIMLITCMYSANLTAFMTLDKIGISIDHAKDLLDQTQYKWGILNQSFVEALLKSNIDKDYQRLVDGAEMLNSFDEGEARVQEGQFVLIDETPFISYNLMGECNIFYVGGELQTFDYAFGFPKNSPYAALINTQMIKLREHGFFDNLWKKYDKTPDTSKCTSGDPGQKDMLKLGTLKGIFFFLCIGTSISLVLLVLEIIVATFNDGQQQTSPDTSFRTRLKNRIFMKREELRNSWGAGLSVSAPVNGGRNYDPLNIEAQIRTDMINVETETVIT
eukprot:sb/3461784/